jgi:Gluconate 2-dehydrogenase subunit 3
MTDMDRREAVALLATLPLAAAFKFPSDAIARAQRLAGEARTRAAAGAAFDPQFFTAHEYQTVQVLVDLIIPKDDRSGSATEAGVPEFMDFILNEYHDEQIAIRGGLAWLDLECEGRFGINFVGAAPAQRTAILDDISWPDKARKELSHGVAFFNRMRDFTASGFFSSKMGVDDLHYMGNTFVAEWKGCPEPVLRKLGVSY